MSEPEPPASPVTNGSPAAEIGSLPLGSPIGIVEVAAASGFSPATVSRALRGLPGVSASTRVAVEKAAATLGYFPSPSASALITGRTNTFGIVAPWVSRWFFSAVIDGAQEVFGAAGYDLLLYPVATPSDPRGGYVINSRAIGKRVDGLLALNVPLMDSSLHSLQTLHIPVVTVGTAVQGLSGVLVDNEQVGRAATRHLLALGHRRIAFFGDDDGSHTDGFTVATDRARGFELEMRDAGLEPDPQLFQVSGFSIDGGEAALHRVFSQPGVAPPTAIFAVSDEVAMGAIYAARSRGLSVPGDLSIIGVDGHDLSYLFDLSTVAQPVKDQGRIAARLLLEQVTGPGPRPPSVVSVGTELIRRGTTGPLGVAR
ncbi:LacI family transcriptional regulator [Nakamurella flava]|uniref:LacI family transcriptional regulator n=1 Tax=Nakamurella flava TaxID=2576308 RepID=A0A4U6QD08_9ACTN|nr:LacI family DNA-binding transcriptional regulator [Nakamurella flava]TKV57852.1 LacI family transcriptional regulator [Nakamurella flava]